MTALVDPTIGPHPTEAKLPSVLTVQEAALLLRLSRNHVYDLIRSGQVPALHLGRAVRIPRDRLLAWMNEGNNGE